MLDVINRRLRSAGLKVSVEQRGVKLSLVATLPPKPDSKQRSPHRQRIALGINASPAGYQKAEKEARKLGLLLFDDKFEWGVKKTTNTIKDCVENFKIVYFAEKGNNSKTKTTYINNYERWFNRLPQNEKLTVDILIDDIYKTEVNTRSRQLICQAYKSLCSLYDLDLDTKQIVTVQGRR